MTIKPFLKTQSLMQDPWMMIHKHKINKTISAIWKDSSIQKYVFFQLPYQWVNPCPHMCHPVLASSMRWDTFVTYSTGLSLTEWSFILKRLFSFDSFVLSRANTSLHQTHWGFCPALFIENTPATHVWFTTHQLRITNLDQIFNSLLSVSCQ